MSGVEATKLLGIKVATVGILIGASGFGVAYLGAKQIGFPMMYIGWLTVCAGLLLHLFFLIQHFSEKK
jgi:hypothetical protein